MRAEAPRPPWGRTRRMPLGGHLKSPAAAFKGTAAGAGRALCTVPRRGQGHATPRHRPARRRRGRGGRRRRGPEGHEGRVGAGEAQGAAPGHRRLRRGARAGARGRAGWLPVRAATQKCRRAKRLTPAWPPPPSPSAPPSFPGLRVLRRRRRRRRRQRRGRRFFFKAAPPNPGLGPSPGRAREGPRCTAPRPSRAARRGICNGRAGPAARYSPLSLLSRPPSPGPPLTGSLCALRLLPKTGRGAPTMHRARRAPLSVA